MTLGGRIPEPIAFRWEAGVGAHVDWWPNATRIYLPALESYPFDLIRLEGDALVVTPLNGYAVYDPIGPAFCHGRIREYVIRYCRAVQLGATSQEGVA